MIQIGLEVTVTRNFFIPYSAEEGFQLERPLVPLYRDVAYPPWYISAWFTHRISYCGTGSTCFYNSSSSLKLRNYRDSSLVVYVINWIIKAHQPDRCYCSFCFNENRIFAALAGGFKPTRIVWTKWHMWSFVTIKTRIETSPCIYRRLCLVALIGRLHDHKNKSPCSMLLQIK